MNKDISNPPKTRLIKEGCVKFCKSCGSSVVREHWWSFKLKCLNGCERYE